MRKNWIGTFLRAAAILPFFAAFTASAQVAPPADPIPGTKKILVDVYFGTTPHPAGQDNFKISLCEKYVHYCERPSLRLDQAGRKIPEGITITPAIPGEWRFEEYNDYEMVFTPSKPWRPDQHYTVTLDKPPFPPAITFKTKKLEFTSAPLQSTIARMEYLQAPDDVNKKLVATELSFNYAVDAKSLQSALSYQLTSGPTQKGKPVPFDVELDKEGMHASVTTPIEGLSDNVQAMELNISQKLMSKDGTPLSLAKPSQINQRVTVPSRLSYLELKEMDAKLVTSPSYIPEQLISLEWNAPMRTQSLGQHLELRLLPKDKPVEGLSPKKDYQWESVNELSPADIAQLPKVPFQLQPTALEGAAMQTLKADGEGNRYAILSITAGAEAEGGYALGQTIQRIVKLPSYPKKVEIMADGSILSLSGDRKLSIVSFGMKKLHYRIARVKSSNIGHLVSQTEGRFASPRFENYNMDEDNLSLVYDQKVPLTLKDEKTAQYSSFDFTKFLKKDSDGRGLFFLTIMDENDGNAEKRFILVTDLGIITKENLDNTKDVFIQSLRDGSPVDGAKVSVIGANGEPVAQLKTDGDGHVKLPSLEGFKNEKSPTAFLVRKGDDLSFMPYAREDRKLNLSAFPIEGAAHSSGGLKAFLFSDRGIYRPGEQLHLGMIVKSATWQSKPIDGLPLTLELTNPLGRVVDTRTLKLNKEGLADYQFTTLETGATGIYNATLYLGKKDRRGEELGSTSVRVEDFQPDKLRITSALEQSGKKLPTGKQAAAWVTPDALSGHVTLMHLYGAPAVGYKVTGKMALSPGALNFTDDLGYHYQVGNQIEKDFDQSLPAAETDAKGEAKFDLPLEEYKHATFRLNFFTEGFEPESGRSVRSLQNVLVSDQPYLVGQRSDANLGYLYQDAEAHLSLKAIDAMRQPVATKPLHAEIHRIDYVSTLVKDARGSYQYQSVPVEKPLTKMDITVPADGGQWDLPTKEPGNFRALLKNDQGVILLDQTFSVAGEGDVSAATSQKANLQVTLNKASYEPGEQAELHLMSPYPGSGLITLETDHVITHQWFEAKKTSSVQTLTIPSDFEGKGYITVQFTRARDAKQIYMSPFSYTVVPVEVSPAARDQKIVLEVPEHVEPGSEVSVAYHAAKPGKVMLYAVDEGILLFGKYKTPDPLSYFVLNRALEVRTSQIMDLLLPEYSLLAKLSHTGGDGYAGDGKNLNPFKRKHLPPVAFWSGIVDVGPDTKHWSFMLPEHFDGRVKIMAVGASEASVGATDKGTNVAGPIVLTPNLPLFAAPGDEFEVPVTIANRSTGSGEKAEVALTVKPSERLEMVGQASIKVAVAEGAEKTVKLRLRAKDKPGEASLEVIASLGKAERSQTQSMSVRPATPSYTTLVSGTAPSGQTPIPLTRSVYDEFGTNSLGVSPLPIALVNGLKTYLDNFPYGCNEQITSKALPNLLLLGEPDLTKELALDPKAMRLAANRYIRAIRERATSEGGFGMWSSYDSDDAFLTAYVMHTLTRARKLGITVPDTLWDDGIRALRSLGSRTPYDIRQARGTAYDLYVLTLTGQVTTNDLSSLVATLERDYAKSWRHDPVALYVAGTYALLQLKPEATNILKAFASNAQSVGEKPDYSSLLTSSTTIPTSLFIRIVSEHMPELRDLITEPMVNRVMLEVYNQQYNSLSAAFGIQALLAYSHDHSAISDGKGVTARGEKAGAPVALPLAGDLLQRAVLPNDLSALALTNASTKPFYYQIATTGFDRRLPKKAIEQGMELSRRILNAKGEPITNLTVGETVEVELSLRAGKAGTLTNMAIVELLPAGFELVPEPKRKVEDESADGSNDESATSEDATPETEANASEAKNDKPLWQPEFADRREDRIVLYGTISTEPQVYRYRLKPTVRGDFVVPPVMAESMYDPAVLARGVASKLHVE